MAEGPPRPASGPSPMMRWLVGAIVDGLADRRSVVPRLSPRQHPHIVTEHEIGPPRPESSILVRFDGLCLGELVRLDTPTHRLQTIVTQVEDGHALLREIERRPL